MSSFEPISASETVVSAVERYLRSNFNPRREAIAQDYSKAIDASKQSRDIGGALFREVRREFAAGKTLDELVKEGVAHPELAQFTHHKLYEHQSKTLQLASGESKNVIVATGTGSGKTESFLLPIINSLLIQRDAGILDDGIRAIIVYPMNALATDQLDRLRGALAKYPDITFGRFVGPTKETRKEAQKEQGNQVFPKNERASREEMLDKPPHILITNYAMLERLLLLPKWDPLFTGKLNWIIMDEIHSYDGSKAVEIAMLLRRVKNRTADSKTIQCIAASATLGDPNSQLDAQRAADFASSIFGEKFKAEDLIRPTYSEKSPEVDPLDLFLPKNNHLIEQYRNDSFGAYHLFVRNPGGAFMCFDPLHSLTTSRIRLQYRKFCPSCLDQGRESRLIELGCCRKCGIEFLIAKKLSTDELVIVDEADENVQYFRLLSAEITNWSEKDKSPKGDENEDENTVLSSSQTGALWWCHQCSRVNTGQTCNCGQYLSVQITPALRPENNGKLKCNRCGSPGERSPFGPIKRPVSGTDALTSVITTALYATIPKADETPGAGKRKLLAFSDNRQDAAYFAPYLQESYFDLLRRRVIYKSLKDLSESRYVESPYTLENISAAMKKYELDLGQSASGNMWSWTWLRGELLTTDIGSTLSDTGLVKFYIPVEKLTNSVAYLKSLNLDSKTAWCTINALIKSVAYDGAIELPSGMDPANEIFAPREKPVFLSRIGRTTNSVPWISESSIGNKRTDMIERAFNADRNQAVSILERLWEKLDLDGVFLHQNSGLRSVANDSWVAEIDTEDLLRCDTCRRTTYWRLPGDLCPTKQCIQGRMQKTKVDEEDHYRYLFSTMEIASLGSKEHTAQWTAEEAERVQNEFIEGKVNVLSCSTTFEMGVDIGSVVAVLCRNVPPTPANYVQRAGRAGRRQGDKALIVTFARRTSHDTQYVADPLLLIKGRIPVPSLSLENHNLIRRHIYTLSLSQFLREINFTSTDSQSFFEEQNGIESVAQQFIAWLKRRPDSVLGEIEKLGLSASVKEKLGVNEWSWSNLLSESDLNERGAWLTQVISAYKEDIDHVINLISELNLTSNDRGAPSSKQFSRAAVLTKVLEDLRRKQMIEPLANGGVLPKYGFPVDIASLVPSFISPQQADRVELQRDLSLAIAEYGPGSQVVAGGHVLTSKGVRRPVNNTFGSMQFVSYTCDACGWFWHSLAPEGPQSAVGQKTQCENCSQPFTQKDKKFFLQPRFGFIAYVDNRSAGLNARPRRASGTTSYVSSGSESDVDWISIGKFSYSVSHNSQLLTITTKESLFCRTCGFAQPLELGRPRSHEDPRNGKTCTSTMPPFPIRFGHEFKTDVFRMRFLGMKSLCNCGDTECLGPLDSACAALITSAARNLGIANADLNGSTQHYGNGENRVNIFDTTPGGVGLSLAIGERIDEIIQSSILLVRNCQGCDFESSCYACLRTYSNQRKHEHLTRRAALDVLIKLV
jgi:ATP-dependent helicase YprA (DUF1998 family)